MPFKKVGAGSYTSPSGRHFNSAQVRLYYANGGKFPGEDHAKGGAVMRKHIPGEPAPSGGERPPPYSKGEEPQTTDYAKGGPVLGRARDFLKTADEFRSGSGKNDESYEKSGKGEKGKDKSLPAVKPRK